MYLFFSGIHTCFVCKKRSEDVRRCMIPVCGKFYHGECIANFAPTAPVNRGFRCSIHVCLTCFIANPNSSSISKGEPQVPSDHSLYLLVLDCASSMPRLFSCLSVGRLVRCVRCPVAYHATDLCMAAGCVVLSNNSIICPNHFTPRRGVKNHEHVNVSWCFVCTEGTALENKRLKCSVEILQNSGNLNVAPTNQWRANLYMHALAAVKNTSVLHLSSRGQSAVL